MKKYMFLFLYVASLVSNEMTQQQHSEEFLVTNEIHFTSDQSSFNFSSLRTGSANDDPKVYLPVLNTTYFNNNIANNNSKVPPTVLSIPHSNIGIARDNTTVSPPVLNTTYKMPWLAAGLSLLFPGLGQMYLGDMKSAGIMAGSAGVSMGVVISQITESSKAINGNIFLPSTIAYTTDCYYSTYAAYRDARIANGLSNYSYRMPMDDLQDLTYAPFQPSILKKPEVWGGILGAMALASATVYFAYSDEGEVKIAASVMNPVVMPVLALPVAIGEESFFRGFLQSMIAEYMGPTTGLILSSLVFGAAHIPNAQAMHKDDRLRYYSFSLPLITTLGAYFGWMTQKNHSLKESVALHMWYDFIIFSTAALASQKASIGPQQYGISVPF